MQFNSKFFYNLMKIYALLCIKHLLLAQQHTTEERRSPALFSKKNPTFFTGLFFDYSDANFECWEKALDYHFEVYYNNSRKRIYAESDFRFPDGVHIPPKRAWPQLWPSTALDYVEIVLTRAPESIVFGHESPEKPCKPRKKIGIYFLGW